MLLSDLNWWDLSGLFVPFLFKYFQHFPVFFLLDMFKDKARHDLATVHNRPRFNASICFPYNLFTCPRILWVMINRQIRVSNKKNYFALWKGSVMFCNSSKSHLTDWKHWQAKKTAFLSCCTTVDFYLCILLTYHESSIYSYKRLKIQLGFHITTWH